MQEIYLLLLNYNKYCINKRHFKLVIFVYKIMSVSLDAIKNLYYKYNIFFSKEKGLGHPDTLWEAIKYQVNNESLNPNLNIDVKTVMDTWTTKAGYPVVSIVINDNGVLNITQERFLLRNLDKTSTNITWFVPITFATQSKPNFNNMTPKFWLSTEKITTDLKIDPKEWVIFNVQSSG